MSVSSAPNSGLNADPNELEKFNKLAAEWWDLEGDSGPLHRINPLRLDWVDQLEQGLSGKRVLDVGCGGGILSESMAKRGAQVLGVDLSEAALKVAAAHGAELGLDLNYELISAEALSEREPESFDCVTCMEMLEHVPDPASVVAACARMVKPGGRLYLSTINRSLKAYMLAVVGAEYVLRLLPRGTHEYNKFIKPHELYRVAESLGLEHVDTKGMGYNPLTKRAFFEHSADVNYLMAFAKPKQA